jgi:hypothetical protein
MSKKTKLPEGTITSESLTPEDPLNRPTPPTQEVSSGMVLVDMAEPIYLNGRQYGPGRRVEVPEDAHQVWSLVGIRSTEE